MEEEEGESLSLLDCRREGALLWCEGAMLLLLVIPRDIRAAAKGGCGYPYCRHPTLTGYSESLKCLNRVMQRP